MLESYKYLFGVSRDRPADAARPCPVIGATINGARLWVKIGPLQFQPGELAKIALIVFLAGYLREKREVLAQGRLKDFGPLLADLGRGDARPRRDERPRQRAPLLRDLPGDALRRHRPRRRSSPIGLVLFVGGAAAAYQTIDHVQRARRLLAAPVGRRARHLLPDRAGARTRSRNGHYWRHRASGAGRSRRPSGTDLIPYAEHRLHLLGARAGARADRGRGRPARLHGLRAARLPDRACSPQDGFSKLLAAGLTFAFALQTFIIVGGLLRVIPLTGHHAPVRQLRRLEHRRELRPARRAPARLEPGERAR